MKQINSVEHSHDDLLIASQDWLGASPIFYNLVSGQISENINNVIDIQNFEFDAEGLANYFRFGYSVFGKTPIKDVFFLRQNESLLVDGLGKLYVKKKVDPCLDFIEGNTAESQVWALFQKNMDDISAKVGQEIVCIPTSGGLDSRLINYFYPAKKAIHAFTYGISHKQEKSYEVVNAKSLALQMGIRWSQVEINRINSYIPNILELSGIATHAHGMYQWEFYKKIKDTYGARNLISGIIGDLWAGSASNKIFQPNRPLDLVGLGYSHGLAADPKLLKLSWKDSLIEIEYEENQSLLKNERYRTLYLIRTKIILLSYLLRVPNAMGFISHSPFINLNLAMSMLTIEPKRWRNRMWQYDFLESRKLNFEKKSTFRSGSYRNDLDFDSMIDFPLKKLNVNLLTELFDINYLNNINRKIEANRFGAKFIHSLLSLPKLGGAARLAGVKDEALSAYNDYMLIKPIEQLLIQRESLARK